MNKKIGIYAHDMQADNDIVYERVFENIIGVMLK